MERGHLTIYPNDLVKRHGLEEPLGKIVARKRDTVFSTYHIAVKFPGQSYWVGHGIRGYSASHIVVMALSDLGSVPEKRGEHWRYEEVIDIPHTRGGGA